MLLTRIISKNVCKTSELLVKNQFYTRSSLPAKVAFNLSDIGEGIREVVVKEWFVKVGDKVSQFDDICEVQSDKASVTITSKYDGIVKKLHHKVDDVALVGKPLVDIETDEESDDEGKEAENATVKGEATDSPEEILAIPSVRRLAKEYQVDLAKVTGTGPRGRILKDDVLKFLDINSAQDLTHQQPPEHYKFAGAPTQIIPEDRVAPIKGFQKAMVKTMTESLKIPHLVYSDELSVTKLSQLRKSLRNLPETKNLSFMPFFIKAASNALQRYAIINSTVDSNCDNITYKGAHNIGVAMDTKVGLAVPVIKDVQNLSIIQINDELTRLIKSGRDGTFTPQDLSGGTFTISNIGALGGTYMKPVILPPQVAIFALGTSKLLPRFSPSDDGKIIGEEVLALSAAADHRIIDGATIARFVQLIKTQIENPYLLFLNL